jgi:phosphoglycolate phosphatase-like HAD superfamily hydrolase
MDNDNTTIEEVKKEGHIYTDKNGILRNEKGLFVKGKVGGPGRTPGKTMKEYVKEYLAAMTEEQKIEWLQGLSKEVIWKMAEGLPTQHNQVEGSLDITWKQEEKQ